jgi:cytokinin dehydrogenase
MSDQPRVAHTVVDLERLLDEARGNSHEVSDFGGLATGTALAVFCPRTVNDLVQLVACARRRGIGLTPRGLGQSQSGQAVPNETVLVDLTSINHLLDPDERSRTIVAEAGATFRDVLRRTLPLGLAPPVCPLNLDLTLGGVLSAGGLGSSSHRFGFAASHLASATVVLGNGEVVRTGPDLERDVFDCVFGGVGRVGFIASVELSLVSVARAMRTHSLLYDDLETMLADQRRLALDPAVLHLDGVCSASVLGLRTGTSGRREPLRAWSHALQITLDAESDPAGKAVLAGSSFRRVLHTQDEHIEEFFARYDIRFEMMRATGAWNQTHPWFETLIPPDQASELIRRAQELPAYLGDVIRLAVVADGDRPLSIAFPGAGPCTTMALLPVGVPAPISSHAVSALTSLNEAAASVGAKRYLSGWLFDMSAGGWGGHYGAAHPHLVELNQRLDPTHTFRSRLTFS